VQIGKQASRMPFSSQVTVEIIEPMGSDTQVWSQIESTDFRFRIDGQTDLKTGQKVTIGFDPVRASLFDSETELRL
jgi:multiple sugar transport system ATP-binding protein